MITGRANPLIAAPEIDARGRLRAQLERLLPDALRLDVTLALEPVPFGFMQSVQDVVGFIEATGFGELGVTVDCANLLFAGSDPVEAVRAAAGLVNLVHVSDTWRDRFAHTQLGRAEIDFEAFALALGEIGYDGPTVYELVDGEDPAPRLRGDRSRLLQLGWG
jgi:sugar phosphate isomerase/epimerase